MKGKKTALHANEKIQATVHFYTLSIQGTLKQRTTNILIWNERLLALYSTLLYVPEENY